MTPTLNYSLKTWRFFSQQYILYVCLPQRPEKLLKKLTLTG